MNIHAVFRGFPVSLRRTFRLFFLLATFAGSSSFARAQLFAWNFNDAGGTKLENSGSAGPAALELRDAADTPMPGLTADGAGVSGKPGDLAFDLSAATGMGSNDPVFSGPVGRVSSSEPGLKALSGLRSVTITGWLRPASPIQAAARIIVTSVFGLQAAGRNQLQFALHNPGGPPMYVNSEGAYSSVDLWMFFAVTFDGAETSDNVKFYVGGPSGEINAAGTGAIESDQLGTMTGGILVGNNDHGVRPFAGLIDNLAIYGSAVDSSGALTPEQIEAVRAASAPK